MTPPFHITERDVVMMQAIARYRFLTAGLACRIVGGSDRGVRNRLRLLAAHDFLVRLPSVVTEPIVYGLANKGARLLSDQDFAINHRLDWNTKNETTQYFRAHTLAVAKTMLHFQSATNHGIRLVDHHELLRDMPEETQHARDPFSLRVTIRHGQQHISLPTVPDRLFSILYEDGTAHNFALELDRGTMDIWANRLLGKSSFRRKLIAYYNAREQKRHAQVWGFKSFRVLTVTTSEERIRSMIEAQRRVAPDCPPGFFLYSTLKRIEQHGALGPAWITSKGDGVALGDGQQATRSNQSTTPTSIDDTAPSLTRRAHQARVRGGAHAMTRGWLQKAWRSWLHQKACNFDTTNTDVLATSE